MSKIKTIKKIIQIFGLAHFLALTACGGSVVYRNLPRSIPSTPSTSTNLPQIMSFTPISGTTLDSRGGALQLIFGQSGGVSPFDVNNAQSKWTIDLKVKSESINDKTFENFVRAKFVISIVSNGKSIVSREFNSEGTLNLKNIDKSDQMIGSFRDVTNGSTILSINAKRVASPSEVDAAKNPWVGELNFVETNHSELKLGDINGFFSGLLTPTP